MKITVTQAQRREEPRMVELLPANSETSADQYKQEGERLARLLFDNLPAITLEAMLAEIVSLDYHNTPTDSSLSLFRKISLQEFYRTKRM